ncbi:MAG: AsnC family transcriptional regulator [Betaproteobacteria bacterium]|nr:AsnC family transcriptional regulator [Betaproteobacteria bacterium]
MDALDHRLLNDFQRDFPLVPHPWAELGRQLGCDAAQVTQRLERLLGDGAVSRVGAVFAPRTVGVSTLAALAAPPQRLEEVARLVSAYSQVNHNYQREHAINLWFVVTSADQQHLAETLRAIEQATGCMVLSLPLEEEYHIDLGFDLGAKPRQVCAGMAGARSGVARAPQPVSLSPRERRLVGALEGGLALVPRPFGRLAMQSDMSEDEVLCALARWIEAGVIKRFGVVVRHHELGFTANAMCVWDVPDEHVAEVGRRLAADPAVTLCYRRRRAAPHWPYNLYCMIHGTERAAVEADIARLRGDAGIAGLPHNVLFSVCRFKQQGARYATAPVLDAAHG